MELIWLDESIDLVAVCLLLHVQGHRTAKILHLEQPYKHSTSAHDSQTLNGNLIVIFNYDHLNG